MQQHTHTNLDSFSRLLTTSDQLSEELLSTMSSASPATSTNLVILSEKMEQSKNHMSTSCGINETTVQEHQNSSKISSILGNLEVGDSIVCF
jgi:hypothetical protein